MIRYLYYLIFSLILVIFQQSVLPALGNATNLNILLVFLVFITIIFGFNLGFIFAVIIGLIYNIYSFLPLGSFVIIYLLVIALVNFLYKQVLINFSFFTNLILIVIATLLYGLLLVLLSSLSYFAGLSAVYISLDKVFLINFLWQIIFNLFLMGMIFILAKLTMKKLNLVFILKK